MGILNKLLLFTSVMMLLGEAGRYLLPQLGAAPLLLNDVLVGLCGIVWIGEKLYKKEKIKNVLLYPILIFISLCIISLLANVFFLTPSEFFISFLYLVRWVMYALFYFSISDRTPDIKKQILSCLFWVGQGIIGIGYIQYFLYPSLGNLFYLGWDNHLYRMFSVFLDPNFAGVIFVLIFILSIGKTLIKFSEKNVLYTTLFAFLSIFDLGAVYLSYSRSALLMLVVSASVFLWQYGKKKYIFAILVFLVAMLFISPKSFQTEGTNILRITSTKARVNSVKAALDIVQKQPILGVGFNAYRYAQNRYGYISGPYWVVSHGGAGVDNSFIFVLATTGIIGFLSYLYMWVRIYKHSLSVKKEKKILYCVVVSSCAGVLMSALFINSLFYIFVMEWLWILLGIMDLNFDRKIGNSKHTSSSTDKSTVNR